MNSLKMMCVVDIRNRRRREKGKSRVSYVLSGSVHHFDVALLWKFTLYGRTYGLYNNFVRGKEFSLGMFWSILVLLFYLEGIYLSTLQQAHLWQLNYMWAFGLLQGL